MSFSMKRVIDLMRVFVITQKRSILVSAGAVYAVLLALFLLGLLTGSGWGTGLGFHQALFPPAFFLAGFIATSMSFASMHRADRSYTVLTLPASHAEKFLEKLLLTAVVYPVAAVASYVVFSLILAGLSLAILGEGMAVFNPFRAEALEALRVFVVAESIFLFGAAYFRSRHFIKTALAVAGLFILLSLVGAAAGWAAFSDLIRGMQTGAFEYTVARPDQFQRLSRVAVDIAHVARFVGLWIMPPALWVLTWLRLRETEVSDAVR
jgi:hypothetical protein